MTGTYKMMREAFDEVKRMSSAADSMANTIADILVGRLRKVNHYHLKRLKKELSQYNAHTGEWKT